MVTKVWSQIHFIKYKYIYKYILLKNKIQIFIKFVYKYILSNTNIKYKY